MNTNKITMKNRLSKTKSNAVKKSILTVATVVCMLVLGCITCFAAGDGSVDPSDFIDSTITILKTVISIIGGALALWGVVNLLESYGGGNPAAKADGLKQLVAGLGLVIVALILVPVLGNMINSAM